MYAHDAVPQFETEDIGLTAFFRTLHIPYIAVLPPKPGSQRARFAFEHSPEMEAALAIWESNGTAQISPKQYDREKLAVFHIAKGVSSGGAL